MEADASDLTADDRIYGATEIMANAKALLITAGAATAPLRYRLR